MIDQECQFLLLASLIVVSNILRHQAPAVLSLLTNSLLTLLVLEVAHFLKLFFKLLHHLSSIINRCPCDKASVFFLLSVHNLGSTLT